MNESVSNQTKTIICDSCDGVINVTKLNPHVTCPFCENIQKLDEEFLQELKIYLDEMSQIDDSIADLHELQSAWESVKTSTSKSSIIINLLVIFLPLLLTVGLGIYLLQNKIIPQHYSSNFGVAIMGSLLFSFLLWYYRKSRFKKVRSESRQIFHNLKCPGCGADNKVKANSEVGECEFCNAPLFAHKDAKEVAIDSAYEEKRKQQMFNLRGERVAKISLLQSGGPSSPLLFIIVPFILIFGMVLMNVLFNSHSTAEQKGDDTAMIIFSVWGIVVLVSIYLSVVFLKKSNMGKVKKTMKKYATGVGGTILESVEKEVEWLNTYWAEFFDITKIFPDNYYTAFSTTVSGFPMMVHLDVSRKKIKYRSLDNIIMILPCFSDKKQFQTSDDVKVISKIMYIDGFVVEWSEGGLVATSNGRAASLLKQKSYQGVLANTQKLVKIAQLLNATPATPIPF